MRAEMSGEHAGRIRPRLGSGHWWMQTHPVGLAVTCAGTRPRPRVPVSSQTSPAQLPSGLRHCPSAGGVGARKQAGTASCRPRAPLQRQFGLVVGLWTQSLWVCFLVPLAAWPRVCYLTSLSLRKEGLRTAAIHRTVDSRSDRVTLALGVPRMLCMVAGAALVPIPCVRGSVEPGPQQGSRKHLSPEKRPHLIKARVVRAH